MTPGNVSTVLIVSGLVLVLAGVFLHLGGSFGFLGKLPGDIRVEREHFRFYLPITTSILFSVVLTLLFWLLSRLR